MSVFDHPCLSGLLGSGEVAAHLSAEADLNAMLDFEVSLAMAEEVEGLIPAGCAARIKTAITEFVPDIPALNEATGRDGVVVPGLLKQVRARLDEETAAALHFGATSQDVIDTSLAMRTLSVLSSLDAGLARVVGALDALNGHDGRKTVMAHTRMQAAMPVTVARKISSWRDPLVRHRERLPAIRDGAAVLHLGGPVGNLDSLGDRGPAVVERLAKTLGLSPCGQARHTERDGLADLANWLSLVTGSLGKTGADIALFAQQEMDEIELSKGGGSSAMPHKVNPVAAETLVALARFNALLLPGMHLSLVHENERSGSAWTLEWMVLPQMMLAAGAALRTAAGLFQSISFVGID